jgi:hypothetical protein
MLCCKTQHRDKLVGREDHWRTSEPAAIPRSDKATDCYLPRTRNGFSLPLVEVHLTAERQLYEDLSFGACRNEPRSLTPGVIVCT